ncbi:opioid-binding protein/cell adhesion molecule homolog [Bombyx mandarina]|uniref:Opioid-binding protein/cell adhesion molecule homolog n=1 Tax=Bombyx mandarina TaxID=7092 RepID=A0A6J2JMS0_BOMMA|nr:opioid-binding protein/cell adhesion molecule homolog [Bombyx mandarina]
MNFNIFHVMGNLNQFTLAASGKVILALLVLDWFLTTTTDATLHEPGFTGPIENVTAPLGREAILACTVHNLSTYKVAWLRVDTQTILTIHTHVISRSRRVGVTHSDQRTWFLHIRELRETDRGWYMCQINTDPMKSQLGYLDVVVPPDILDRGTSTDQTVREGASVSLTCAATGSPHPQITWRREHSKSISISDGIKVTSLEGPVLNISRVNRQHAGAYLCIASNGVPPTVSKRIMLTVEFPPVITIRNQLVGAGLGTDLVLECETEAYPKPVSYWSRETGEIVPVGGGLEPQKIDGAYRSVLRLAIRRVTTSDYGTYKCVSKNSMGDTEGTIKLYPMPLPAMENRNVVQRLNIVAPDKSSESTPFGTQDFRLQDYNRAVLQKRFSNQFLFSLLILINIIFICFG